MRHFMLALALLFTATVTSAYERYVVAQDVEMQFDGSGNLRFCERANLRGMICQQTSRFFGKSVRMTADWWHPETYVQARTGFAAAVTRVSPTPDGRGLVIFFEAPQGGGW